MEQKNWIRLDNASNIFLAARNDIDTKVFRFTVKLKESVDPAILQMALTNIYEKYPLFHSVLRRGIFWYYLERSEFNPRVQPETKTPVTHIYQSSEKNFMFRVLYKESRIHLEVFHVLTDGTGALWFFEDLITEYIRLRYEHEDQGIYTPEAIREKADLEDSFKRYFKEKKEKTQFSRLVDPFVKIYRKQKEEGSFVLHPFDQPSQKNIYHVKGNLTPDTRPRIVNVTLSVKEALALSRPMKVSLTMYLTAVYILSVYQMKENKDEDTTISVSIPINLRQFFPSVTVRNFFSTTTVEYTFKEGKEPDLYAICQEINAQFQKQLEKDAIEKRLKRYVDFEQNPVARILLRSVKDLLLKGINKLNNRKISVAMSNVGIVNLPEPVTQHVDNLYLLTSVTRPQFCVVSFQDNLNVTFTSPFIETDIFQYFVKFLSDQGLKVIVDANKVTEEELNSE